MKMHIIQTFFDFYMHDKAEFESFDVDFVFLETDFWKYRLKIREKQQIRPQKGQTVHIILFFLRFYMHFNQNFYLKTENPSYNL